VARGDRDADGGTEHDVGRLATHPKHALGDRVHELAPVEVNDIQMVNPAARQRTSARVEQPEPVPAHPHARRPGEPLHQDLPVLLAAPAPAPAMHAAHGVIRGRNAERARRQDHLAPR